MKQKIVFLLGSANMSGGTYVILQHAEFLAQKDYDVTIALVFMELHELEKLKQSDYCWHPAIKKLKFVHIYNCHEEFDVAIFTWWATILFADKINAKQFIYFVQSIESRFYPKEHNFMQDQVNRTYQLGLPVITEANWIKKYLAEHFHSHCELARNGILKNVYKSDGNSLTEKSTQQLRILVEGPLEANFKNVPKTIEICNRANVGEVWLLTSSKIGNYPGVSRVFSQVPIEDVPAIYRSCDVLVKLSYVEGMFGPPLEIFHCGGTAIVYSVTGYDEYIKHDFNALVANPDDENAVIEYLKKLHQDRDLLNRLISGAKKTAADWIDWQQSSTQFENALEKIISQPALSPSRDILINRIQKYFTESMHVVMIHNNQTINMVLGALPLHDSGHYLLSIHLTKGISQLGIIFGKNYQKIYIFNISVVSNDGSNLIGHLNVQASHMTQNPDNTFSCIENSMLVVDVDVQNENVANQSQFYLKIIFAPVSFAVGSRSEVMLGQY